MNALWPCHSSTPKSASKLSVMVYLAVSQPIPAFRARDVGLRRTRNVHEGRVARVQVGDTTPGTRNGRPTKRKQCRTSNGRRASARERRHSSGQTYCAATMPEAKKLKAIPV